MDKKAKIREKLMTQPDAAMVLKKHVGLIHCENKLTLIQRKICNILLFNALDHINEKEIHAISLRQLCSLIGYNSHDSKLIKESIKSLISAVMEWNLLEDNKFLPDSEHPEEAITWNASSLLAGASITAGLVRYSYSPQIKTVLSSLDIYGRINLFVQSRFDSTYSLVLYENCVRFKNIHKTSWFSLKLFRSLMGVTGDKYASFKELKRNVIKAAVDEVNQKSDIFIEPCFKKTGKNVTAIQFLISENEKYRPAFKRVSASSSLADLQRQSTLIEMLIQEYHFSEHQAKEITLHYAEAYILEKMQLVKTKKNIEHRGAYLLAALKKDYKKGSQRVVNRAENSYQREAKKASEIQPLRNKYMTYKSQVFTQFVQQQAESIQMAVKEKFEQLLAPNKELLRLYKKSGMLSPFVMANFIHFIEEHFASIIGSYLTFDDYISSEQGSFVE